MRKSTLAAMHAASEFELVGKGEPYALRMSGVMLALRFLIRFRVLEDAL